MRSFVASLFVAFFGLTPAAHADKPMIVVELFTSQGCSSCPPADALLADLARNDDVIGLGYHVDYWDYLGWKDKFANPKFTKRQVVYNAVLPSRYSKVTPQIIVHGLGQVAGGSSAKVKQINALVRKARAQKERAAMQISRSNGSLQIMLNVLDEPVGASEVHLVHYTPSEKVVIGSGENGGRTLKYTNIVSSWDPIAKWDGRSAMQLSYPLKHDAPLAVIVQSRKQGPVFVARKLH